MNNIPVDPIRRLIALNALTNVEETANTNGSLCLFYIGFLEPRRRISCEMPVKLKLNQLESIYMSDKKDFPRNLEIESHSTVRTRAGKTYRGGFVRLE